jgi:hypothetical protein
MRPSPLLGICISCRACGEATEVSPYVHIDVPLSGMRANCWACGGPITIPPHPSTVEAAQRDHELIGMGMIAAGDVERGKAYLEGHPRPGRP